MVMHVVLGNGELPKKEMAASLQDLWGQAGKDTPFWFVVQGKSEPTATDQALMKWLHDGELYYEIVTDDADAVDEVYSAPQAVHVAKQLPRQVVKLMTATRDGDDETEGEDADILALFSSDDPEAEEDRWLNRVLQAAAEADFPVYAFNDGLMKLDLSPSAEEEEEETPPVPAKKAAAKTPAKKVAAKPREEDEQQTDSYTREQLSEMEMPELKAIATAKGIELAPRTRMNTYIDAILGESRDAPAVEITEPPVTVTKDASFNGDIDMEELADAVAELLVERIAQALRA